MSSRIVDWLRSPLATVSVVETDDHRFLLSNEDIIGCEHRHAEARNQMAFSAMALMSVISFLLPTPANALCLGLGAGTVPSWLRSRGITTDIVEHDAAVIRLAEQRFLFGAAADSDGIGRSGGDSGHVHEDDALQFVAAKNSKRYDVVLSDLWNGGNEGRALLRPFFEQVRSNVLRPNGTMALNLVAFSDGPHVGLAVNVVRTLRSVFGHVQAYTEHDPEGDEAKDTAWHGNVLLLASDAPIRFLESEEGGALATAAPEPNSMDHLFANFQQWRPKRLNAACEGREGVVLHGQGEWDALISERRAALLAMREQQRQLLSADAWGLVEEMLHEAEDMPPRIVRRAPSPVTQRRMPDRPKEELR